MSLPLIALSALSINIIIAPSGLAEQPLTGLSSEDTALVNSVHAASLIRRDALLHSTIAGDSAWPHGTWGDSLWTLAALQLNEKTDQANARLFEAANAYIENYLATGILASPTPENPEGAPWTFFSLNDYVRTLCLFNSKSAHYPGRLLTETEAVMKEALWLWASQSSLISDYGLDNLYMLLGTENHDLNTRPVHYLVTSLLADDPAYRDRMFKDGHTTSEHATAHTAYFREWPRQRAMAGLWIEIGSNGYQKYSWPALFNLHELSPDPIIREEFGKLLDLALIEEAQVSVDGRRGGGRSRSYHSESDFNKYKDLLLVGDKGLSSHSRIIESSKYQAPAYAILLRHRAFPVEQPFVIRNIVPGEVAPDGRFRSDPAQGNYAYRTPHYLLGSTLMNPQLVYSGISYQNRTCGMLFHDPAAEGVSQVYPTYEGIAGKGRPQNSIFTAQHENVLIVQRIASGALPYGSYSTGKLSMRFDGTDLQKTEQSGWIFTTNGKAFAAVRFLDGGYMWNDAMQTEALPTDYAGGTDTSRILIQSGDIRDGSFGDFKAAILANQLTVTTDDVNYRFGSPQQSIQVNRYVGATRESFVKPLINGITQELRPSVSNPLNTYESPYLSMDYESDVAIARYPGYPDYRIDFNRPPQWLSTSPQDAQLYVNPAGNIVFTFTKTVFPGTGRLILRNITSGNVVETFVAASSTRLAFSGRQLIIDPSLDLDWKATYQIEIDPAAVVDNDNASFPGITSGFSTPEYPTIKVGNSAQAYGTTISDFTVPSESDGKLIVTASWESGNSNPPMVTWKGSQAFTVAARARSDDMPSFFTWINPQQAQVISCSPFPPPQEFEFPLFMFLWPGPELHPSRAERVPPEISPAAIPTPSSSGPTPSTVHLPSPARLPRCSTTGIQIPRPGMRVFSSKNSWESTLTPGQWPIPRKTQVRSRLSLLYSRFNPPSSHWSLQTRPRRQIRQIRSASRLTKLSHWGAGTSLSCGLTAALLSLSQPPARAA